MISGLSGASAGPSAQWRGIGVLLPAALRAPRPAGLKTQLCSQRQLELCWGRCGVRQGPQLWESRDPCGGGGGHSPAELQDVVLPLRAPQAAGLLLAMWAAQLAPSCHRWMVMEPRGCHLPCAHIAGGAVGAVWAPLAQLCLPQQQKQAGAVLDRRGASLGCVTLRKSAPSLSLSSSPGRPQAMGNKGQVHGW